MLTLRRVRHMSLVRRETLLHSFCKHVDNFPDSVAYVFPREAGKDEIRLTYYDLWQKSTGIAEWLKERCASGDRVLLVYQFGADFIISFLGCLLAGCIAVPVCPPRPNGRGLGTLTAIKENSGARAALTNRYTAGTKASSWQQKLRIEVADSASIPANVRHWPLPQVDPGQLAVLQYTSGSTGAPRGVMISHDNLMDNLQAIASAFQIRPADSTVVWLPPYHDMGLVGGLLEPLYCGCTAMVLSPLTFLQKPIEWLSAISGFRATINGGPNFAYDLCVSSTTPEERKSLDLSSWRVAFNGAEPVRAETLERFTEAFGPFGFHPEAFFPCYGMAETTLFFTGAKPGDARHPAMLSLDPAALEIHKIVEASDGEGRRVVSCGYPLQNHEICVVDPESGILAAPDEVGEIWLSGSSIGQGYWNDPRVTQKRFNAKLSDRNQGGFLRTGDLGFMRKGELFITGRLKDMIIIRGRNLYPEDIEHTSEASHPAFRPGSAIAFSVDVEHEERLVLVHEVRRSALRSLNFDEIVRLVRAAISKEHEIQLYALVLVRPGTIPRTSSGKLRRAPCRSFFLTNSLEAIHVWKLPTNSAARSPLPDAADTNGSEHAMIGFVAAVVAAHFNLDADSIDPESRVEEYGMDSLQAALIASDLQDRLGFRLAPAILQDNPTVSDLARHIAALKQLHRGLCSLSAAEREYYLSRFTQTEGEGEPNASKNAPETSCRFEEGTEYRAFQERHQLFLATGLPNPFFTVHEGINNEQTTIGGRTFINFSSNNYLGLCGHPAVSQAAVDAILCYGTGVCASRIVSGERPVHRELEQAIAEFVGVQDCLTFVGGNTTNVSTIGHLFGSRDLVVYDELSHNSLVQGAKLGGCTAVPFPHNDWMALDELLGKKRGHYQKALVFIEGIYSMDGDVPDLARFIEVKDRHRAMLMVDECLSIGVLGETGRGLAEFSGVDPGRVEIWMGGISKAFASCGGYIAGPSSLIQYLRYTAPGFIYTTGMSPANAAAAVAAIKVLRAEPERVDLLRTRTRLFLRLARACGLDTGKSKDSPVVPIILGEQTPCLKAYEALLKRGINVQPIFHPAVPPDSARLRFFLSSTHSEAQIEYTIECLAQIVRQSDRLQDRAVKRC